MEGAIVAFYYSNWIIGFNRYTSYNYSKYCGVLFKFLAYKILAYIMCDNIRRS